MKFVGVWVEMSFGNVEQNIDEDLIKSEERDRLLKILTNHLSKADREYQAGLDRDAGKWTSCNSTDYPRGKVDALEQLRKELVGRVKKK